MSSTKNDPIYRNSHFCLKVNNLLIGSPSSRSLAFTDASPVGTVIARAYWQYLKNKCHFIASHCSYKLTINLLLQMIYIFTYDTYTCTCNMLAVNYESSVLSRKLEVLVTRTSKKWVCFHFVGHFWDCLSPGRLGKDVADAF